MITEETRKVLHTYNLAACCNPPTIHNTYELTRRVIDENIPGDLVECGVYAGAQIAAMWKACQDAGVTREIHAFDSFQGCPAAGEMDDSEWQAVAEGKACCERDTFQLFMDRWGVDGITVHEGWFEDTVPNWAFGLLTWEGNVEVRNYRSIALLRLDGDLYSSTMTCLTHLYPLVSPGGFVVVDDYALRGCRTAVHEYFGDDLPELHKVEGGGGPVWFRK